MHRVFNPCTNVLTGKFVISHFYSLYFYTFDLSKNYRVNSTISDLKLKQFDNFANDLKENTKRVTLVKSPLPENIMKKETYLLGHNF